MRPIALAFLTLALLLVSSPEVAPSALPRPLLEDILMTTDSAHTDANTGHACTPPEECCVFLTTKEDCRLCAVVCP